MSGRENLRLLAAIDGIGIRRVDEVLEHVGLGDRAGDLVKKYSLGMRQRLALAAVLLKDPALLILDEPANGLDPAGIRDVRTLLRSLGDEGRTVFVSSHVLAEVEQTCDSVAILRRGRCVAQGKVADVMASAARGAAMLVALDDLDAGHRALRGAALPVERQNGYLRVGVGADAAARITETLAASGSGSPSCAPRSAASKTSSSSSPMTRSRPRRSGDEPARRRDAQGAPPTRGACADPPRASSDVSSRA